VPQQTTKEQAVRAAYAGANRGDLAPFERMLADDFLVVTENVGLGANPGERDAGFSSYTKDQYMSALGVWKRLDHAQTTVVSTRTVAEDLVIAELAVERRLGQREIASSIVTVWRFIGDKAVYLTEAAPLPFHKFWQAFPA
jgi:hypothetical protein